MLVTMLYITYKNELKPTEWKLIKKYHEISQNFPSPGRTGEYMKEMIILGTCIPNLDLLMLYAVINFCKLYYLQQ